MVEPSRDRFFVHRVQSPYRLALRDGSAFPDGTRESEWQLTRIRDASDVNADVREAVAANGYRLFAIGLKLDVIRRSQPWRSSMAIIYGCASIPRKSSSTASVSTLAASGKRHYTFARRKGPVRSNPLYMQGI
jgi:hypothetical protein